MKKIRQDKDYILYKDEDSNLYTVQQKKSKLYSQWLTKDEAESIIIDDYKTFKKECKKLQYENDICITTDD